jgi:hypothetical protein
MEDPDEGAMTTPKHIASISWLPKNRRAGRSECSEAPSAQWGYGDRTLSGIDKPTAKQMPNLAKITSDAGNDGLIRKRSLQLGRNFTFTRLRLLGKI